MQIPVLMQRILTIVLFIVFVSLIINGSTLYRQFTLAQGEVEEKQAEITILKQENELDRLRNEWYESNEYQELEYRANFNSTREDELVVSIEDDSVKEKTEELELPLKRNRVVEKSRPIDDWGKLFL